MRKLHYLWLYFDDENGNEESEEQTKETNETGSDERTKPKYSEDDVDKIVAKRVARMEKQKQKEIQKERDEATRLATMTAQERAEHERDELQKELNALKRANTIAEMEREARKILAGDGITVSDDIVSVLVSEDADDTSKAVKAFADAFKKAVQDEVKKQLSHKKPATGARGGTITKEQIMNEPDPLKRQKLIREHMNLFR